MSTPGLWAPRWWHSKWQPTAVCWAVFLVLVVGSLSTCSALSGRPTTSPAPMPTTAMRPPAAAPIDVARPVVTPTTGTVTQGPDTSIAGTTPTATATAQAMPSLVSQEAQRFLTQFQHHDFAAQWDELAPVAQAQWPSPAARTAMLTAKFRGITIRHAAAGDPIHGAVWRSHEDPARVVKGGWSVPVSLTLIAPQRLRPAGVATLYTQLHLTLQVMASGQVLVDGEGPASIDAPLIVPGQPATEQVQVPILMYHRVGPYPRRSAWTNTYGYRIEYGLTVTPAQFDAQVARLVAEHATAISLTRLADTLLYGLPLPPRPVVFTFDDGRESPWIYAVPRLRAAGFTADFFVCSGFVGQTNETAAHLNVQHYLSWSQVTSLTREGFWIEDHGRKDLTPLWELSATLLPSRVQASAQELMAHTHQPVQFVAYTGALWPYPHASQAGPAEHALFRNLGALGYVGAVVDERIPSVRETTDHIWQLPRLRALPGEFFRPGTA
ncbi:MAG: polysaccharide deacetylase family protein [Chloroflexi bacterium]|nr:polysaccharide deacetylase family protein [Chloroflexota bacterium]